MIDDTELTSIAKDCQNLIDSNKTLMLSTLSLEGNPEISYTPYIRTDNGKFYIFVSELAHHTPNLLANRQCSILFLAPESETQNLFARERVFVNCEADKVLRGTKEHDHILNKMQDEFGHIVELLRGFSDFHLFALKPVKGLYIVSFGKAFTINDDGSLTRIVIDKKWQQSENAE